MTPLGKPSSADAALAPESQAPLLACHNLGFTVGGSGGEPAVRIVQGVTKSWRGGEFFGICGPNGAGKTTLLRLLGGLLPPAAGEVTVAGDLLGRLPPRETARRIAFMHQDTQVPFEFSVLEVVLFGRHPYATPLQGHSAEDRRIAMASLAEVECDHLADRPVSTLSGGERQRVMLARVLAQDTPILLLDEPTSSLDIRYNLDVFETCQKLAKQGRLVIAVLHDLRAAARFCTRLCLMHEGAIVADGDPEEVLHEGHIAYVYGIRVQTYRNPAGAWDYVVP